MRTVHTTDSHFTSFYRGVCVASYDQSTYRTVLAPSGSLGLLIQTQSPCLLLHSLATTNHLFIAILLLLGIIYEMDHSVWGGM